MEILILIVGLITSLKAYSQNVLSGTVISADDNKPVEYASIGITSKPDGTLSNTNLVFSIKLDYKITDNDIFKFSSIGYQSEAFLVGTLKQKIKTARLLLF